MNMVIPIDTYSAYQAARSNVAIPQNKILSLNGKTGLHPAMTGIQNLYKDGKAAVEGLIIKVLDNISKNI